METIKAGIGRIIRAQQRYSAMPKVVDSNSCPDCDGVGIVVTVDAHGRTVSKPCRRCNILDIARERRQFDFAKIPCLPEHVDVHKIAKEYVEHFNELQCSSTNWILFTGRSGSGKTTNAAWIATQIIERYKTSVRFYSAFDVTRRLATTRGNDRERLLNEVLTTPYIVLDDFLKTFPKKDSYQYADFFQATLEIVWGRNDAKLPTAITTQQDFKTIAIFDSALAGRIVENCAGRVVVFDQNSTNRRVYGSTRI